MKMMFSWYVRQHWFQTSTVYWLDTDFSRSILGFMINVITSCKYDSAKNKQCQPDIRHRTKSHDSWSLSEVIGSNKGFELPHEHQVALTVWWFHTCTLALAQYSSFSFWYVQSLYLSKMKSRKAWLFPWQSNGIVCLVQTETPHAVC